MSQCVIHHRVILIVKSAISKLILFSFSLKKKRGKLNVCRLYYNNIITICKIMHLGTEKKILEFTFGLIMQKIK